MYIRSTYRKIRDDPRDVLNVTYIRRATFGVLDTQATLYNNIKYIRRRQPTVVLGNFERFIDKICPTRSVTNDYNNIGNDPRRAYTFIYSMQINNIFKVSCRFVLHNIVQIWFTFFFSKCNQFHKRKSDFRRANIELTFLGCLYNILGTKAPL